MYSLRLRLVRGAVRRASSAPPGAWSVELAGSTKSPMVDRLWRARMADGGGRARPAVGRRLDRRPPSASRVALTYPFASDEDYREQYTSAWGTMRIGRILEDLDALAGNVALRHADDGDPATRPPLLVTAAVERVTFGSGGVCPLPIDEDLVLSGAVGYCGRSSLEILLGPARARAELAEPPLLRAKFTFVARDRATGRAAPINALAPQTADERARFDEGEAAAARAKEARAAAAARAAPVRGGAAPPRPRPRRSARRRARSSPRRGNGATCPRCRPTRAVPVRETRAAERPCASRSSGIRRAASSAAS